MKLIKSIPYILCFAAILYMGFSYIDVVTHNEPMSEHYGEYSDYNFFVLYTDLLGDAND